MQNQKLDLRDIAKREVRRALDETRFTREYGKALSWLELSTWGNKFRDDRRGDAGRRRAS